MLGKKLTIEFMMEVVIEPDEDGFHAYCPALRGLHTYGQTREESLENVKTAASAYIDSLIKHNDPIPVGVAARKVMRGVGSPPSASTIESTEDVEDVRVACAIS